MTDPATPLLCEQRDRIGWVRLNRPQALNALTLGMIDDFAQALTRLACERSLCALVIAGGERAFSAGADLKDLQPRADGLGYVSGPGSFVDRLNHLLCLLEEFPLPTIAAVRGWAMAGGLEIVLACDLVIAGENARFGDAHANYGLLPGGGSSVRLPRRVGAMRARQMMSPRRFRTAPPTAAGRLVTTVAAERRLGGRARWPHGWLRAGPAGGRCIRCCPFRRKSKADALRAEQLEWGLHATSDDMREGIAAFREKRTPRFTGT